MPKFKWAQFLLGSVYRLPCFSLKCFGFCFEIWYKSSCAGFGWGRVSFFSLVGSSYVLYLCWKGEGMRVHRELDRWPQLTKGMSQTIWHLLSIYSWGRRRKWRCLEWWHLSSRVTIGCHRALGMAEHLPARGEHWKNSLLCFALLMCTVLALPFKLTLAQPTWFFHLDSSIISPAPLVGG